MVFLKAYLQHVLIILGIVVPGAVLGNAFGDGAPDQAGQQAEEKGKQLLDEKSVRIQMEDV